MNDEAIISYYGLNRKVQIYDSAAEAARDAGVTKQAVSYAIRSGGKCSDKYWKKVKRIFVIKKDNGYFVCYKNGDMFKVLSKDEYWPVQSIAKRDVADITAPMWEKADWDD